MLRSNSIARLTRLAKTRREGPSPTPWSLAAKWGRAVTAVALRLGEPGGMNASSPLSVLPQQPVQGDLGRAVQAHIHQ